MIGSEEFVWEEQHSVHVYKQIVEKEPINVIINIFTHLKCTSCFAIEPAPHLIRIQWL